MDINEISGIVAICVLVIFFLIIVPVYIGYYGNQLYHWWKDRKKKPEPLPKSAEYGRVVFCKNCKYFYSKAYPNCFYEIEPAKKKYNQALGDYEIEIPAKMPFWRQHNYKNNCEYFEPK